MIDIKYFDFTVTTYNYLFTEHYDLAVKYIIKNQEDFVEQQVEQIKMSSQLLVDLLTNRSLEDSTKTKLFDLLQNHIVNSVVDYATGVETGLDSNARKNRGGHLMENLVESYIQKAGFVKGQNYFKEMYIHEIEQKWNVNLSAISNQGKMEKRFDFVIKTDKQIYVIETNFYASGGSKLNETARSYKTLAQEVATIDGVTFIWFTDGCGWNSAKNNLEETFDVLDTVYNIQDLESDILKTLIIKK